MKFSGLNVYITTKAYSKINEFVRQCNEEISGFGKVVCIPEGYLIKDAFILKQEVSGASTDIDSEELIKALTSGKNTKEWRLWWHSHVDMEAFWSGTDTDTIGKLLASKPMISLVINKRGEYLCRLDWINEGLHKMSVEEMPLQIFPNLNSNVARYCRKEIKKKVRNAFDIKTDFTNNTIYDNAITSIDLNEKEKDEESIPKTIGRYSNGAFNKYGF